MSLTALVEVVLVLACGYALTTRVAPWVFVRVARAAGFRAELTPVTRRRLARFKRIRRGFFAFQALATLFVVSLFLELLVNGKPLVIHYGERTAFPAVAEWADKALFFADISSFQKRSDFGMVGDAPVDYRAFARWAADHDALRADIERTATEAREARAALDPAALRPDAGEFHKRKLAAVERKEAEAATLRGTLDVFERGDAWIVMPLYPFGPSDLRYDLAKNPPNAPSLAETAPLGTDASGRDVVPLMLYGFRISIAFALLVSALGQGVGILVGGAQGYFGGWIDILSQRFVEIWGSIPFLFVMMILASIVTPSFAVLCAALITLRAWIAITYYVRGEFYREKSKDYVQAAIGCGVSDWKIITRHILPNAIVPIVTFTPFAIVSYITTLVSLDFLGFGLPPGTPSWGGVLKQGLENLKLYPHLTVIPTVALAATLYAVVLIGEAVREAFDPKVFSRLR